MATTNGAAQSNGLNHTNGSGPDLASLGQKYEEEKEKRVHPDRKENYIDLELDAPAHLARLIEDPWVDHDTLNAQTPILEDGDDVKFLILGAGFCGLLYAARLIQAGFKSDDIRLVDVMGGWGGTWYSNRYPGLMCDSESYIYLPLLEETGYMPKHRYSHGPDILAHAERIAAHFDLKGVFRTYMQSFTWDDAARRWIVQLKQSRGPKEEALIMTVRGQFVVLANGVMSHPKAPKIDGLDTYEGEMLHTARWRYDITGGSPNDPRLTGLEGKKVGFIGTGATGVQCITQLAKWAEHLYVFQRTPAMVDERGQRATDPKEWKQISGEAGWWTKRNANFLNSVVNLDPENNLVNDAWTTVKSFKVLVGHPENLPLAMEDIPGHIGGAVALDAPRTERLRKRVELTVTKDRETSEGLKAWYPSWCKRPCFHDDYLPTFNRPNVTLVQTQPALGVKEATPKGLVVDGKEYELDVIVFGSGYRSPASDMSEPSKMCNTTITGRDGVLLSEKWLRNGPATLHGCLTNGFPNLFLTGPAQAGASPSITYLFDIMARHTAQLISAAAERSSDPGSLTIEATVEAEEAWTASLVKYATLFAPISLCLPGYLNNEGSTMKPADMGKSIRGATHALGLNAYAETLADWRDDGKLDGVVLG
ncbi:Pentalenolactone D synthase [Paramyrothecium foliicola]|nr:Pentalenolactone D synthase [Paramyrothecium foliicola]